MAKAVEHVAWQGLRLVDHQHVLAHRVQPVGMIGNVPGPQQKCAGRAVARGGMVIVGALKPGGPGLKPGLHPGAVGVIDDMAEDMPPGPKLFVPLRQ